MTFRVTMLLADPPRTITVNFAGCTDAEDAKQKARTVYDVAKFKKVELAP